MVDYESITIVHYITFPLYYASDFDVSLEDVLDQMTQST